MYILANGRLVTRDPALPWLADGGVAVEGTRIAAAGTTAELRERYPEANIVSVDYDPGASKINQENRIKLMLSAAR